MARSCSVICRLSCWENSANAGASMRIPSASMAEHGNERHFEFAEHAFLGHGGQAWFENGLELEGEVGALDRGVIDGRGGRGVESEFALRGAGARGARGRAAQEGLGEIDQGMALVGFDEGMGEGDVEQPAHRSDIIP